MNRIFEIMNLLAVHLGEKFSYKGKFPVIRKEQSGKKPGYPYAAYKKMTESSRGYRYREEKENPNPAQFTEEFSKNISSAVSLTFYNSENKSDSLKNLQAVADAALDWLSVLGKEAIAEKDAVVVFFDYTVQDRTVYLEPVYEYQLGFDFIIRETKTLDRTMDAVDIDATLSRTEYHYE